MTAADWGDMPDNELSQHNGHMEEESQQLARLWICSVGRFSSLLEMHGADVSGTFGLCLIQTRVHLSDGSFVCKIWTKQMSSLRSWRT